jgi:hypothetical protein
MYSSPTIVWVIKSRIRWARLVARMGEGKGAYKDLEGKHERKRQIGRPRRRLEDITRINMELQEVGRGGMD